MKNLLFRKITGHRQQFHQIYRYANTPDRQRNTIKRRAQATPRAFCATNSPSALRPNACRCVTLTSKKIDTGDICEQQIDS
jgi:hypothetical protein